MKVGEGAPVSTTIELRRLDRASAAAMAVHTICAKSVYAPITVGEGVFQFSRVYRPRWATVSGWVLTVGLLGAGYWLLLIKRTETCTMWVSEDRATVRVILAGGLLPEVFERLCSAFDAVESTAGSSSDVNDSERVALDKDDALLPSRVFRSFPTPKPAVIDLVAFERDEIDHDPPDRPPPVPPPTVLDLPEVRFDTGERVRVMGVIYVGRDPMHCDANGRAVERIAVADASGTVAKTHFAMGADLGGLWVEDLFSATGTAVGTDLQSARPARPLEHTAVAAGETIFFGNLSALVLAADDRAVASLAASGPSSRV
jgi:hypothetical protein